ncbi:MAG: undecaprenyl-diphosphate phosphatase [Armatimonadetes bacterium]|nr:undecaprenyl-diphosphate phosphatase [Armatimonadota bacterium]
MDLIQAIVLGIIQGLTEWLPISSTAHLRIIPALLGWQDPGSAFTAVIQLGTLAACLIYFREDLGRAFSGWFKSLKGGEAAKTQDAKMGWAIFIGTIPIIIFGLLFKNNITGNLRGLNIVAYALIFVGLLMLVAEKIGSKKRTVEQITPRDGLIIGLWQAVALIPGSSRSGSTITGGMFAGFDRASAARFSFLLSVPSVLAAGVKELISERHELSSLNMSSVIVCTLVSFVVGYASIAFLVKFLQKNSTTGFVVYRICLGVLLLFLLNSGQLKPDTGLAPATTEASQSK